MNEQDIIKALEEVLQVDESSLEPNTKLEEIEEWDSMSQLSFISFARKQFDKRVTIDELVEFEEVKDICNFLTEK